MYVCVVHSVDTLLQPLYIFIRDPDVQIVGSRAHELGVDIHVYIRDPLDDQEVAMSRHQLADMYRTYDEEFTQEIGYKVRLCVIMSEIVVIIFTCCQTFIIFIYQHLCNILFTNKCTLMRYLTNLILKYLQKKIKYKNLN